MLLANKKEGKNASNDNKCYSLYDLIVLEKEELSFITDWCVHDKLMIIRCIWVAWKI